MEAKHSRLGQIIAIVVVSLIVAMLISIMISFFQWQWNNGYKHRPEHIRSLGLAVLIYAQQHNDQLPDSLELLVQQGAISPEAIIKPRSRQSPATGTGPALENQLKEPGHNSYTYLGKGKTVSAMPRDAVLIYESTADPDDDGVNIYGVDGHVEWIFTSKLDEMLAKQNQ